MEYVKRNTEEIEIEDILDEETDEYRFGFTWDGQKYFLDNFIRTHDNPWVGGEFPEYIHGFESDNYYHPLFIELIGDHAVNIFEELTK